MRMKKPVCVKCEKEFRKIWHCDIYKCPKCGVKIVYGYGENPIIRDVDGEEKCREFIKNLEKDNETIVYEYE